MAEDDTAKPVFSLPAPITPTPPRAPIRGAAPADFVSQLIAERHRLAPQRQRRRATIGVAVDAYDTGSRIAVRRMPAGFRTTLLV